MLTHMFDVTAAEALIMARCGRVCCYDPVIILLRNHVRSKSEKFSEAATCLDIPLIIK